MVSNGYWIICNEWNLLILASIILLSPGQMLPCILANINNDRKDKILLG